MEDNEIDAELLALAGDEESDEGEQTNLDGSDAPSPKPLPTDKNSETRQESSHKPPRGVAQKKRTMQSGSSRRRRRDEDDEEEDEGEASDLSHNSLGSGAMSESESDTSPNDFSGTVDDGVVFPVDGRFYSQKDKDEIMAMSEIKREEILAERAQEVERRTQNMQLKRLLQAREKDEARIAHKRKRPDNHTDLDDSPRKSSRPKTKASENLEAYKRQREQRNEQRRRDIDRKNHDQKSSSRDNGQSDPDGEGDSEVEWDERPMRAETVKDESIPELRDLERIRVGRSNFAKVCFYPGFNEAIKGCFCRVNIGPDRATGQNQYRLTQIKGFTTGKMYAMEGPNGKPINTDQYALVAQGKAEKEWPFLVCSDGKFTEPEFERYKRTLSADGMRLPTLSFLNAKLDGIHKLLNHQWTEEELAEKLKRSGALKNKYASLERNRIIEERTRAVESGDEAMIARLDQELSALDGPKLAYGTGLNNGAAKLQASKAPTQQERLAALNRANRRANQEEIRKAQILQKHREQQRAAQIARGEATADRFARVKTKAKVHYDAAANSSSSLQVPANKNIDDLFGDSDRSRAGTPSAGANVEANARSGTPLAQKTDKKPGPGGFRKRNMDDEILGAMDLGIEIDI